MSTDRTHRRVSMRRTEWVARLLVVAVLAYGAVAFWDYNHEVWPFFAWNLFTKVPTAHSADYDVRILEARGLRVPAPAYFEDAHIETDQVRMIQAYQTLQNWGLAHRNRDAAAESAVRKRFESLYLSRLEHVRYEFVQRVFDIRERLECAHCFTQVKVVGSYTVD